MKNLFTYIDTPGTLDGKVVAYIATHSPSCYAAVGTDGTRQVVWGLGDTEEEALADAATELREQGCTSELRTVGINEARRSRVQGGDVEANDL